MSYVLINGKRYYKDDQTGRTTLDNVSQEAADRRAQRNQATARNSVSNYSTSVAGSSRTTANAPGSGSTTAHRKIRWRLIIAIIVIIKLIEALFYNCTHVSAEEQAIISYMNKQQTNAVSDTTETETDYIVEEQETISDATEGYDQDEEPAAAAYLMPDSANRFLSAYEITGYSHDEIQMIINEIYARHGREFRIQKNIDYFSAQAWYQPVYGKSDEDIVREFNEYEKANVELLSKYL